MDASYRIGPHHTPARYHPRVSTPNLGAAESPIILQRIGLVLGPILAAAAYTLLPGTLDHAPRAVAAVGILMSVWWITEAAPLPVTSLLPVVLFPLLGATDITAAGAPYADRIIFLFAGGLLLGLAMQRAGLHTRIALTAVSLVGTNPKRLIAGVMIATALLSMWVSNTATAVMMLPIGTSIAHLVLSRQSEHDAHHKYARNLSICLMLAIAYGASIGGIATLIGTPPNAVFAGYVSKTFGQEIGFLTWMRVGLPLVAVYIPLAWATLVFIVFPISIRQIPGGRELIREQRAALGPITRSELVVLLTFACTVALWIARPSLNTLPPFRLLTDGGIAMAAALVLFLIPRGAPGPGSAPRGPHHNAPEDATLDNASDKTARIMDWHTATRLPWGVLLLFGGGLSLGAAMTSTGLDQWIGQQFAALQGMHPAIVITILVVAVVALSELASNTAVATTLMPVLGAAAVGMGLHPYLLLIPLTLASSCGFMLPVATPPNTVVFASGYVSVRDMIKGGFVLDLIGIVLVVLLSLFAAGPLLGENLSRVPDWALPP